MDRHQVLFDAFDASVESFDSYIERLQSYFLAMEIGQCDPDAGQAERAAADNKKVAHFISCVGRSTYAVLRDLCSPQKPAEKTFDALCELLANHFKPKRLDIAETYKFHQCSQKADENISEYSARLRKMAATCNFGENLQRALRDQFVTGIRSMETRKKLLGKDHSFDDVIKLALADEAATRETSQLMSSHSSIARSVNSVQPRPHFSGYSADKKSRVFPKGRKCDNTRSGNVSERRGSSSTNTVQPSGYQYVCCSCGKSNHRRSDCKYRNATCHLCSRKGHISYACRSQPRVQGSVHNVEDANVNDSNDTVVDDQLYTVRVVQDTDTVQSVPESCEVKYSFATGSSVLEVPVRLENCDVKFQLDTGCGMSVVPKQFYDKYLSHLRLQSTGIVLETYTKERMKPLGIVDVSVMYENVETKLPLLVTETGSVPLFGRNWLSVIKLNWPLLMSHVHVVDSKLKNDTDSSKQSLNDLLCQYDELFDTSALGCYTGEPIELNVKKMPPFCKARPVPYALQAKVESTLRTMETNGVIERVSSSPCAAPIVVVGKKDSDKVRICGDFSVTYNSCADLVRYPLPKIEDLHTAMRGCKVFSCIDIREAYHNCRVSENSQKYLTINTHVGLFVFKRLPNGVHSGPAIFQQIMDTVLAGIPKVICRLDDILCGGVDVSDHLNTLSCVLARLQQAGFRLNKDKCRFLQSSVKYLGHVIDAEGLHPTDDKLKAIREAPPPKDVTALKAYLGLLMFYSRFLPNHATVLAPLNRLLKADVPWQWTKTEAAAFEASKKLLCESQTLVHYDNSKPLYLSCDASQYGAGAVLNHLIDGSYRPIAFASCTFTKCQFNYSQLEKEAFSIIFALKKFHQFLAGLSFTIITDHRPLLSLFAPDKSAPVHTAARLQRWSLILSSYKYKLQFRKTTDHLDADCMSRLPLHENWNPQSENVECYFVDTEVNSTVTSDQIQRATRVDPVLSRVYTFVINGWPSTSVSPELRPYKERQNELSVEQGCVLWGMRVIIPDCLQVKVLDELHETHPGMSRMKAIARSFVWWPNIDKQIEKKVSDCVTCQAMKPSPPASSVHPWTYPLRPWSRLHADFAGPINGFMYLIVVCAYSKYPEVVKMKSTTSAATITALRELFSRHGLCEILVTDNGPQFVSQEFETFCINNGILHRTSAVYKPATNGQAERVVRILKTAVKQAQLTHRDVDVVIAQYLLIYRSTPHATTGEVPSILLMGRRLRTRHDLMVPSLEANVQKKQLGMQKVQRNRQFEVNDSVLVRNFSGLNKWESGMIVEKLGNRYYLVVVNGTVMKRHVDQIIRHHPSISVHDEEADHESTSLPDYVDVPSVDIEVTSHEIELHSDMSPDSSQLDSSSFTDTDKEHKEVSSAKSHTAAATDSQTDNKRYPVRIRNTPSYLSDYVKK